MSAAAPASLVETDDEALLRDAARGFLAGADPLARLRAMRDEGRATDPELWREMAAMGWAGVLVDEANGGSAMGHRAAGILAEEMGRTLALSPFTSSAVMAATALAGRATDRLSAVAAGDLSYAIAVDEGPKHNLATTALAASRVGNRYRLDGCKRFVADGGAADRILVLARTGGSPGGADGLTVFDLEADRAGIERTRRDSIDARDAADITFNGVEATGDDVLGDEGNGLAAIAPAIRAGQAAVAAELAGLSAGAFAMTVDYLKDRKQFGVPIGSFQALQHRAAHLWTHMEVTASAIAHAGRALDDDADTAQLAVSLAKARAADTARLAVAEGVQMHGGIGMTDAHNMGFFVKRARVATEWLGDYGHHAAQVARLRR